ncbi:MAG: FtsX-like permease family protein [Phycisphaerae bacterium]
MKIVDSATPVIYTAGLLRVQNPDRTNTVRIEGIDLAGHLAVTKFGSGLHRYNKNPKSVTLSKPAQPPDEPDAEKLYGLIYGLDISGFSYRDPDGVYQRYIHNYTSCMISVIPLTISGKIMDAVTPARTQKFYMVDDSRTKVYDIDANYVYVDFNVLQKMLYMDEQQTDDNRTIPARTTQIHIKVKPSVPINDQTLKTISTAWFDYSDGLDDSDNSLLKSVEVNRWETYNAPLISAVENEKRLMIMLFGIISIVAVFLILAIFYMIVVEKTRDIGILKSIGASAYQIAAIFLAYGGVIGFIGSILGTILGYYFVEHINEFQNWLINVFGWRVWNREVYAFDEIPSRVEPWDVTIIIIAAIVASIIGALVPAIRAARMNPVEALRYE